MTLTLAGRLLEQPTPNPDVSWEDYLKSRIDPSWRPDEFDPEALLLSPKVGGRDTMLSTCVRVACGVHLARGSVCATCHSEHRASGSTLDPKAWAAHAEPREFVEYQWHCDVAGCQRTHAGRGLCQGHLSRYMRRSARGDTQSVQEWIADVDPAPLGPTARCVVGHCGRDVMGNGLCAGHNGQFGKWRKGSDPQAATVEAWLSTQAEPYMDNARTTFAEKTATPFALLPEPLRWELIFAVQQRDKTGRLLDPVAVRSAYLRNRKAGITSVVGLTTVGVEKAHAGRLALYAQWQHYIDLAYREWSGIDERDPRVVYLSEIDLRETNKKVGPGSKIDLRGVSQDWVFEGIVAWLKEAPRGFDKAKKLSSTWVVAAQVLERRGTPVRALGMPDMDAVVQGIRDNWGSAQQQKRRFAFIKELLDFTRNREQFQETWGRIPARFAIDQARHRATGTRTPSASPDEPFRFVPQPIIEHLMNNLHLLVRKNQYTGQMDPYRTAEAQAMLYVHERSGRRSIETTKMLDDCISYDNEGAPYLEWVRGKPPYTRGKRLPIHQETHDAIRQWQAIKRDHGINSRWLFPSIDHNSSVDSHWDGSYIINRLKDLIDAVEEHAPFTRPVEGADGNLIYFNLRTIDPYSFRHAFAQRYADATDADGRPTTPPDVLQELMGHANINTTGAYFEVSKKRRRKALEAVAPRRLNLLGMPVPVDRERDGFTKVAVTLGHCTEPQNVAQHGNGCMVNHACESCPFFLVDPLERDGMEAKRHHLRVQLERARAINAQQHLLDHYEARIKDTTTMIDGIDAYIAGLPEDEQSTIRNALDSMAEVRRLATAPRRIDLRVLFQQGVPQ